MLRRVLYEDCFSVLLPWVKSHLSVLYQVHKNWLIKLIRLDSGYQDCLRNGLGIFAVMKSLMWLLTEAGMHSSLSGSSASLHQSSSM